MAFFLEPKGKNDNVDMFLEAGGWRARPSRCCCLTLREGVIRDLQMCLLNAHSLLEDKYSQRM